MRRRTSGPQPKLDPWERDAWAPPAEDPIDVWVERNIVFPSKVSALPGPLDLSLTPYLREILRAYADPETEEITLCTSTQVGKTTVGLGCNLYSAAEDPWNALVVMPRDDDAQELNQDRYQPTIRESPTLARLMEAGSAYDLSRSRIRFPGMSISFTGANSPAALASRAARTVTMDEIDKWPEWSGREADPVELVRERTRTFWNRKLLKMSTPTTERGYIWRELQNSTNERYHVPCPRCGAHQELVFGSEGDGPGIKWSKGAGSEEILRDRLAWYACETCGGRIQDGDKPGMLRAGRWEPTNRKASRRYRGFHLWAGYSPWLGFSEIAAKFLTAKRSQGKMMNFYNSWLGLPWRTVVNELRGITVRARLGGYLEGGAPEGAWALTAGVDVQGAPGITRLYYVLRAWGLEGESWLVRHGFVEGWEVLSQVLFRSTYRAGAKVLPLHMVLVDSGDGNKTEEVYDYCLRTGCWAYKGASAPKRPITPSAVDRLGDRLSLALVDPNFFKTRLHRLVQGERWHLPSAMSEEYFAHMVAEQLVPVQDKKSGRDRYAWRVVPEGTPNHYFDCEVMALAAAEILELGAVAEPIEVEVPAAPEEGEGGLSALAGGPSVALPSAPDPWGWGAGHDVSISQDRFFS